MIRRKRQLLPPLGANTGAYSPGIAVGNLIFVSGQGPLKPGTMEIFGTTIEEQTRQTLENVEAVLQAAGCTLNDCVKLSAHLADIRDFDRYNKIYQSFFAAPFPARTTVQSSLWGGMLIEIDAMAIKGCHARSHVKARLPSRTGRPRKKRATS